jgi:succinate-semialdehyde dehydrogenase/glutarate-semialdehyde dehydrogenase
MATQAADRQYVTVNPYTNEEVHGFDSLYPDEIDAAVQGAHDAYASWRRTPIDERARIVRRVGDLMLERAAELAGVMTLEVGKLIGHSMLEVGLSASILQYYGDEGPRIARKRSLDVDGGSAVVVSEPLGVLLGVMPWNFPLYQVARFAGPNVVLGNTILLKHAGNCPQSALALEQLFLDAGAPVGVYTNIFAPVEEVERIIANPVVQGVSLTGSERAGAAVGQNAGRNLKKAVLELGGSDPFIVLDRGDLESTIDAAVFSRMFNTGQACEAAKRFIVVDELFDEFVAGMRDRLAGLEPGDPADPATTFGPVCSEQAAVGLVDQVQDAIDKGATVVIGGGRIDRPGAFVEPTILTGVTPDMRVYHEELFGPVAVVYRVPDEAAAVELANDSPFGLGGAVFCSDPERARRVADRLECGMVWINSPVSSQPDLPFGGVKRSGFGRELSDLGMREFVNHKLIRTVAAEGV